ncbi:MAG: DNA topoisomerase I, partial [Thermoplasmata archaeon]|nr:DNA topoisomerase I [Thermoplasmata archaeon]
MTCLIICEKNNAAQRISAILSSGKSNRSYEGKVPVYSFSFNNKDCRVVGLRGHILGLDYPTEFKRWQLHNLEELAMTDPIKRPTVWSIASALKVLAKGVDEVIIATDFDREGELIGAEALEVINSKGMTIKRARFSALTKPEVTQAFENLIDIDMNLARAAETRQIIDLAWGATLTRFVSIATGQTGKDFLSVGRVQSPTLALVVDRDIAIESFESKPFWELVAELDKDGGFKARHAHGVYNDPEEASKVFAKVEKASKAKVKDVEKVDKKEAPPDPFSTTQFLLEANRLGLSPAHAMSIAESLYTSGFISYPRTDNTVYPKSLPIKPILKELMMNSDLSKDAEMVLSQDRISPSRGRKETTDHPPIHPTTGARRKDFTDEKWKVYELVTRRFLATLAPWALGIQTNADLDIEGEEFKAQGYTTVKRGWYEHYPYSKTKDKFIPELKKGEEVPIKKMEKRESKTKPPSRYNQGSLLKEMEKLGLGTKSTRHEIIQKLYDRRYIEGGQLQPTTTGKALIKALEESAEKITLPEMTSILEEDMEKVAEGKKEMKDVIGESKDMLVQ